MESISFPVIRYVADGFLCSVCGLRGQTCGVAEPDPPFEEVDIILVDDDKDNPLARLKVIVAGVSKLLRWHFAYRQSLSYSSSDIVINRTTSKCRASTSLGGFSSRVAALLDGDKGRFN
jgi:hypothetical protein